MWQPTNYNSDTKSTKTAPLMILTQYNIINNVKLYLKQ